MLGEVLASMTATRSPVDASRVVPESLRQMVPSHQNSDPAAGPFTRTVRLSNVLPGPNATRK